MTEHVTITDPQIHEPKGVAAASSGQTYVADGTGSGAWTDQLASVNNRNIVLLTVQMDDLSTASFVSCPASLLNTSNQITLSKIYVSTDAAATGINTITAEISATPSSSGTAVTGISIATSASDVYNDTATGNNTLGANDCVRVVSDGAGTGTVPATIVLQFDITN